MAILDKIKAFFVYLLKTYYADQCLKSAAALSYTTLLSLVPLMAVVFSVFAAFPVFETIAGEVQSFVFKNFVPASGEVVQQHIEQFTSKATSLTAIGISFLIVSALLMMNTIEEAINNIWHIKKSRKALPKFMVYWAVLTLGPLLIGASLVVSSYLISLPLISEVAIVSGLKTTLLSLLPFFATTLACTLLYSVVPNTRVPLYAAFAGAAVAAMLFELAKKGFAYYVTAFPTYEIVYGALAAIPVFLVWIYISWLVILLGAEISYCLTHKESQQSLAANIKLLHDFRTIGFIWQAQRQGSMFDPDSERGRKATLKPEELDSALQRLEEHGLAHQSADNSTWALSKDMSTLTLADLYAIHTHTPPQPSAGIVQSNTWYRYFCESIENNNKVLIPALAMPLQPVYEKILAAENNSAPANQSAQSNNIKKERIEPTF